MLHGTLKAVPHRDASARVLTIQDGYAILCCGIELLGKKTELNIKIILIILGFFIWMIV